MLPTLSLRLTRHVAPVSVKITDLEPGLQSMIVTDSAKDSKELCESIKIWLAVAKNPSYESNDKRALYTQAMINLVNRVSPRTTDLDLKDVFRKIDFDSLIKKFWRFCWLQDYSSESSSGNGAFLEKCLLRLIGLPIKEEPDDTDNLITELFDMDFNKRNDWLDLIDKAKKMYNSNVLEWAFKKYETLRFEEDRKKRLLPKEDAEEDIEGTWRATNYQFHYNQLEQTLREARIALGVYTEVLVDSQTREEDMKREKDKIDKIEEILPWLRQLTQRPPPSRRQMRIGS